MESSEAHATSRVHLFEGDGSRRQLSPGEWTEQVFPREIEDAWDDAPRLRALVELALEERLGRAALEAARRLKELEPDGDDAAQLLARALLRSGDAAAAERVLEDQMTTCGPTPGVLVARARLHTRQADRAAALALLRRALALDPNHREGLERWTELHGGASAPERDDALEACLVEVAGEPGAWRPQLRLGQLALARGEDAIAMDCFRSSIARSGSAHETLQTIAYALADAGRIDELVELCGPEGAGAADALGTPPWDGRHGPDVLRIVERLRKGRAIVEDLLERELPLLAHHFGEIETSLEVDDAPESDPEGQLVLAFADTGEGNGHAGRHESPAALRAFSYRAPLFGLLLPEALALLAAKERDALRVSFFAASSECRAAEGDPSGAAQSTRASRDLEIALVPTLLAEAVALMTDARTYCTLPYRDANGLLRRASPYAYSEMRAACRADAPNVLVGCHVARDERDENSASLQLSLWSVPEGERIAELREPLESDVAASMVGVAERVAAMLTQVAGVRALDPGAALSLPRRLDAETVGAWGDLLDLALVEAEIAPRTTCEPAARYKRLLAMAERSPDELLARIASLAGLSALGVRGEELRGLIEKPLRASDGSYFSVASHLPELALRLAVL